MKELRAFPRLSLACEIEYSLIEPGIIADQEKVVSKTRDISKGGICLITYLPLNKGDILDLRFRLQGYKKPIEAKGKVVWTQEFKIGDQKGYDNGIEFVEIPEEHKSVIEEFIKKTFTV